jgi:carbonic anhydrase
MTSALIDDLIQRNERVSIDGFVPGLKMMPLRKTIIIGCADPRVDPFDIFGLQPGEAAIIRNIGGRLDPGTLQTMALLRSVVNAMGGDIGPGWNMVVLHHTDCGIRHCLSHAPEVLARHMGVPVQGLDELAILDPHAAVALDVASLKANPKAPRGALVTGLVYDVATGRTSVVVPTATLGTDDPA